MTKMSLFSDRIKSRKHKEERTQDQKNTMKKIDKSDIDQHGANRYIYRFKDKGTITKYASDKETAKKEIEKEINVDFRDEKSIKSAERKKEKLENKGYKVISTKTADYDNYTLKMKKLESEAKKALD